MRWWLPFSIDLPGIRTNGMPNKISKPFWIPPMAITNFSSKYTVEFLRSVHDRNNMIFKNEVAKFRRKITAWIWFLKILSRLQCNYVNYRVCVDRAIDVGKSVPEGRRPFLYIPACKLAGINNQFYKPGFIFEISFQNPFQLVLFAAMNKSFGFQ